MEANTRLESLFVFKRSKLLLADEYQCNVEYSKIFFHLKAAPKI